jgi:hypothetical protein
MPNKRVGIKKSDKKAVVAPKTHSSGFNFIVIIVAIGFLGALITYAQAQITKYPSQPLPTITLPTSSPTQLPTATPKPYVNPDPIITCNINASCGGGSRQLRQSVCDSMNCCLIDQRCGGPKFITKTACNNSFCCLLNDGTGKLLSSKSACDNYATQVFENSINNQPTYPSCTVYYPVLGYSQTYTDTPPETCQTWQDQASSVKTAPPIQTQQVTPVDNSANNQQCKATASQTLNEKEQGVRAQYGGTTGTADFEIQNVLIPEYNQAVANCDQLYPI